MPQMPVGQAQAYSKRLDTLCGCPESAKAGLSCPGTSCPPRLFSFLVACLKEGAAVARPGEESRERTRHRLTNPT